MPFSSENSQNRPVVNNLTVIKNPELGQIVIPPSVLKPPLVRSKIKTAKLVSPRQGDLNEDLLDRLPDRLQREESESHSHKSLLSVVAAFGLVLAGRLGWKIVKKSVSRRQNVTHFDTDFEFVETANSNDENTAQLAENLVSSAITRVIAEDLSSSAFANALRDANSNSSDAQTRISEGEPSETFSNQNVGQSGNRVAALFRALFASTATVNSDARASEFRRLNEIGIGHMDLLTNKIITERNLHSFAPRDRLIGVEFPVSKFSQYFNFSRHRLLGGFNFVIDYDTKKNLGLGLRFTTESQIATHIFSPIPGFENGHGNFQQFAFQFHQHIFVLESNAILAKPYSRFEYNRVIKPNISNLFSNSEVNGFVGAGIYTQDSGLNTLKRSLNILNLPQKMRTGSYVSTGITVDSSLLPGFVYRHKTSVMVGFPKLDKTHDSSAFQETENGVTNSTNFAPLQKEISTVSANVQSLKATSLKEFRELKALMSTVQQNSTNASQNLENQIEQSKEEVITAVQNHCQPLCDVSEKSPKWDFKKPENGVSDILDFPHVFLFKLLLENIFLCLIFGFFSGFLYIITSSAAKRSENPWASIMYHSIRFGVAWARPFAFLILCFSITGWMDNPSNFIRKKPVFKNWTILSKLEKEISPTILSSVPFGYGFDILTIYRLFLSILSVAFFTSITCSFCFGLTKNSFLRILFLLIIQGGFVFSNTLLSFFILQNPPSKVVYTQDMGWDKGLHLSSKVQTLTGNSTKFLSLKGRKICQTFLTLSFFKVGSVVIELETEFFEYETTD